MLPRRARCSTQTNVAALNKMQILPNWAPLMDHLSTPCVCAPSGECVPSQSSGAKVCECFWSTAQTIFSPRAHNMPACAPQCDGSRPLTIVKAAARHLHKGRNVHIMLNDKLRQGPSWRTGYSNPKCDNERSPCTDGYAARRQVATSFTEGLGDS
jgi:hypothetical protein